MKTLLTATLMLISIAATAQIEAYGDNIFNYMTEETNGYYEIEPHIDEDGEYLAVVQLPEFYGFELVRIDARVFVRQFSDVTVAAPWSKQEHGYTQFMMIDDGFILMFYYVINGNMLWMKLMKNK
ncbi:MAG: hypothetical protein ACLFQA_00235 [Bacteroidales bacterium]